MKLLLLLFGSLLIALSLYCFYQYLLHYNQQIDTFITNYENTTTASQPITTTTQPITTTTQPYPTASQSYTTTGQPITTTIQPLATQPVITAYEPSITDSQSIMNIASKSNVFAGDSIGNTTSEIGKLLNGMHIDNNVSKNVMYISPMQNQYVEKVKGKISSSFFPIVKIV